MAPIGRVDAQTLIDQLADTTELAVLDAREQGVFFDAHLFHAACIPLSHLELELPRLVPRKDTPIVWCDDGASSLAERAAERATDLGWMNVHVLEGGTTAWHERGGELYSGVNVPSKAFGEFVEHHYGTPKLPATKVKELIDSDHDMVILDSRPMTEFRSMSIPGGVDCPGAELVHRVREMVSRPDTLVVVNCAGRTRSIIGSQSLVNAGLANPVVALENGTMGWELAGFETAQGDESHAPDPGPRARAWAETAAASVAARFGVREVDHDTLASWRADSSRTTFLFDVRTPEEYAAGHLAGSVSAPGGQLVQATDEYVATRNARLVLVDDNGVRATMTASWLRQMGWADAVVLRDGLGGGEPLVTGEPPRVVVPRVPTISVSALAEQLASETDPPVVLDLGTSLKYRDKGHIPGAWWGIRSRLAEARHEMGDVVELVLTSTDGQVAKLAVPEARIAWPDAKIRALAGGNKAWRHAGHDMEPGLTKPTTSPDDVWYKPYERSDAVEEHMQAYLDWEVALVAKIERDITVTFPTPLDD
ncbi:MAG: rhodanese-like domain-containing protein [Acidimicrobiales bacterium]